MDMHDETTHGADPLGRPGGRGSGEAGGVGSAAATSSPGPAPGPRTSRRGLADRRAEVAGWLSSWLVAAEDHVTWLEDDVAWYGSGYGGWGVQTAQKYMAAATAVSSHHPDPAVRSWARARALATLRHTLRTHRAGTHDAPDGRRWPSTWISALGLERAGFAIDELRDELDQEDRELLRVVLLAEADWLLLEHERGGVPGLRAGRWGDSEHNWPESNLWNGCHLWRTAARYPQAPRADAYRERAVQFLLNGVSVPADATDTSLVDGQRVAEVHVGANFFDSYALDHQGYLNIGYMVMCTSNAAIAHLDWTRAGHRVPAALHHHQAELWQRVRACLGPDGRLVRIGGDSRVRYAYCQEYLLPALLYAERHLGDTGAAALADAFLSTVGKELAENDGRSFYGRRLSRLATQQPYYWTRLETDRAATLAFWLHHTSEDPQPSTPTDVATAGDRNPSPALDPTGAAGWSDLEHGFALVRGPRRFASFSWRARSLTQVLALPTDRPDLAEWAMNLSPVLRFEGDGAADSATESPRTARRLIGYWMATSPGGFASVARVEEGVGLRMAEGWDGDRPAATSTIAVVALPDDATVVGLHLSVAGDWYPPATSVHGLNLLVPDDVYNGHHRTLDRRATGAGTLLRIDDVLDVVSIDGDLEVRSHPVGSDPALRSIGIMQVVSGARRGAFFARPRDVLVDCAWLVHVRDGERPTPTATRRRLDADRHEITVVSGEETYRVVVDLADRTPATHGSEPVGVVHVEVQDPSAASADSTGRR